MGFEWIPTLEFFSVDCSYKKNDFIPWYQRKSYPWHTSFTLHIHLGQPHLPPTTYTIILLPNSQISISNPVKLLECAWDLNVQCSLYISYCCPSLSTFISENSNSHFPYILLKRQKRSLISFLSPWQKPRSFFNWTVTSYIHVVTNSFWFYHFSSQASLFLSICETTDLFQAFIHSLLGYIIILHVFDLSSLILLSISLPKWDFQNQSVPKQQK